MNDTSGLRVEAEGVGWWLDPASKEARKQLSERNEALAAWLEMVEKKVQQKLAEIEAEEGEKIKA